MQGIIFNASLKDTENSKKFEEESKEKSKSAVISRKYEETYISDKEIELLTEQYSKTVVQDFGDIYHYTKEERDRILNKNKKLFELRNKRFKCPLLSEYVRRWRAIIDIINDIAESNTIMPKEEFVEKTLKGEISITGLTFPKYNGKGKKNLNWDYVIPYIMDETKDPDELDDIVVDRGVEEEKKVEESVGISPMLQKIIDNIEPYTEDDLIKIINGSSKLLIDDIDIKDIRKISPDLNKSFRNSIKNINKSMNKKRTPYSGFNTDGDDFDYVRRYDRRYKSKSKPPKFNGSFLDDKAYERYMDEYDEYERENTILQYNGRFYTPDQIDEINLKNVLEQNGWNIRKLWVDKEAEKKLKKKRKADERKEKEIKKLLVEIQNRKESRDKKLNGLPQGINIEEKKKKKSKKKKGSKNVKNAKKGFENILFNATPARRFKNLKKYKKEMEKW